MSRPNAARPLGTGPKPSVGAASNPITMAPVNAPRRSAGAVPGIARAASNLRQSSSPTNPSGGQLTSLPAHLRNLSTPRIPSPLGKGTPARNAKQSFPARTSKMMEKHVFLPEDPQLAPLPRSPSDVNLRGPRPRSQSASSVGASGSQTPLARAPYQSDERSDAEKMTKREREENGLPRLTAYSTAEGYRLKLLSAFLKREHGVAVVRVFDDCVYAVYHLPLLPGYGASTRIRSSPAVKSPGGVSMLERMTQAEEVGYEDEYFPVVQEEPAAAPHDPSEYILSHSPPTHDPMMEAMDSVLERSERGEMTTITEENQPEAQHDGAVVDLSDPVEGDRGVNVQVQEVATSPPDEFVPPNRYQQELYTPADHYEPEHTTQSRKRYPSPPRRRRRRSHASHNIAEAVFFSYGVSVFYGFQAGEERTIMADCEAAGTWQQPVDEDDWEVEEFHYVYDTEAESPRIYNDMFTFKSRSHLFKLSLAHAIAQSTKLSLYEARMQESLELTSSFPKELSVTGHLQLDRKEALKLTGAMYKLRMDVNLIGGILDTPELFWSEASLYPLYEAINQYLEIGPRVQVLNDRLAVVGDLLEIIHDYVDQRGMDRVTWIIIWLIVIACIIAGGEIIARLAFHSIVKNESETGLMLVRASRKMLGVQ